MVSRLDLPNVSVVIPFYRRYANLQRCLVGLLRQAGPPFEIIVAAFRPDRALQQICDRHPSVRIAVVPGKAWNVARSRNIGMQSATGEVLVFLDADIIARPTLLQLHASAHAKAAQPCLSVGRVLGFLPYGAPPSPATLRFLESDIDCILEAAATRLPSDPRWQFEHEVVLPWAFCWSGNIGILRAHVFRHKLAFNEDFQGWGGEDLEWAFRAYQTGAQVKLCREAWGVHLPHARPVDKHIASEQRNFARFLQAHPRFEVEIVVWLNDLEANRRFTEIVDTITQARGIPPNDRNYPLQLAITDRRIRFGVEVCEPGETSLNLLGVATPFPDKTFSEVSFAPWIKQLPQILRQPIEIEAARLWIG